MIRGVTGSLFFYLKELNEILTRKQKRDSVSVFFFALLSSVLEMIGVSVFIPYMTAITAPGEFRKEEAVKWFADKLGIADNNSLIILMSLCVIIIYIIKDLFLVLSDYVNLKYDTNIQRELSVTMLGSYLKRPYEDLLDINTAEALRGVSYDVSGMFYILSYLIGIFSRGLTIVFITVFLIKCDPYTSLLLGAFSAIVLVVYLAKMKNTVKDSGKSFNEAVMNCTKASTQAINGIKEISVTKRNDAFIHIYEEAADKQRLAQLRYRFLSNLPNRVLEMFFIVILVLVILIKIMLGGDILKSIPNLTALAVGAIRIMPYVANISTFGSGIIYYLPSLNNLYDNIIKSREYCSSASIEISPCHYEFKNRVDIEGVEWKYHNSDTKVLSNINMHIDKGEAIGIVGSSGAGKSTLADIFLGLLYPQIGSIRVDGIDCKEIKGSWSKLVGYVPQMPFLLDDSIKNNILFGLECERDTDYRIMNVLKKVKMDEYVEGLPDGMETIIGERGVKISGGQRQRIAIARVLYYNPDIILMDEATSALDSETEKAVMDAIEGLRGSKTLIIIAHRTTTLRTCDRIYRIENGEAKEVLYDDL